MRTIFKSIIIAVALCLAGNTASAQSLKDILGNVSNNSTVNEIVEKVTGVNLSKGDIKGTWNYTGSAVKLESEEDPRYRKVKAIVNMFPGQKFRRRIDLGTGRGLEHII